MNEYNILIFQILKAIYFYKQEKKFDIVDSLKSLLKDYNIYEFKNEFTEYISCNDGIFSILVKTHGPKVAKKIISDTIKISDMKNGQLIIRWTGAYRYKEEYQMIWSDTEATMLRSKDFIVLDSLKDDQEYLQGKWSELPHTQEYMIDVDSLNNIIKRFS